jgi:HlyD family secretion protein
MKLSQSSRVLLVPAAIVIIALIILVIRALTPAHTTLTGIVETSEIDIASKIPGRIDSLYVTEGDAVHRGEILAVLTSKEVDAKVEQARGAMDAAKARLQMARNGARSEEREAIEKLYLQTQHQYDLAEKTWKRIQAMYRDSVISAQEHDQVQFQFLAAREQRDAAQSRYQMVLNGTRTEDLHAAEALVHQAENVYKEAVAYQDEARLVCPIDGELCKKIVEKGELVASGYPVMTVINPSDSWVVLTVREDQLASIAKGKVVGVTVPSLGSQSHQFVVTYVAAMADFATWRATNQKGDFDLKTFEVRLRAEHAVPGLRPGMTARVEL